METGQTIYTCPECGGEVITLGHPYIAAAAHTAGCSLDNGNDPDYIASLGPLLGPAEIVANGLN